MHHRLNPDFVTELIFGTEGSARFTQDSPVLPNVWAAYGETPSAPVELLFTPHIKSSPGVVGSALRARLAAYRSGRDEQGQFLEGRAHVRARERPRVAYNQFHVAARLYFDEMIALALPLTAWWDDHMEDRQEAFVGMLGDEAQVERLAQDMACLFPSKERVRQAARRGRTSNETASEKVAVAPEILWLANIGGAIGWAQAQQADSDDEDLTEIAIDGPQLRIPTTLEIARAVRGLLLLCEPAAGAPSSSIWAINCNRPVESSVSRSVPAVKADAARQLFDIRCKDIAWAVLDSGIDASHPAFVDPETLAKKQAETGAGAVPWWETTRVVETYDFTRIRSLLDPLFLEEMLADGDSDHWLNQAVKHEVERRLRAHEAQHEVVEDDEHDRQLARFLADVRRELEDLELHLQRGRQIDWGVLQPFLRVPHSGQYEPPSSEHGTHVAGILGANVPADTRGPTKAKDERERRLAVGKARVRPGAGVCPDIRLYDLRVLGRDGDEFSVISALQFIGWLNAHRDYLVVQGANLSLSIRHEVYSFACGATPVCEEADRLVSSGVVVVAAAGNHGHQTFRTDRGPREGYLTVSITDPGNAAKVITVGATHRSSPHTYGVSYFSSRGPTGDGRVKPDLVAPGEKIGGPVPQNDWRVKDGTSMAAPHVSGAAALLIARHTELMGKAERVKEILCSTATDLGRERYFQGHGMVDVLRALQSV